MLIPKSPSPRKTSETSDLTWQTSDVVRIFLAISASLAAFLLVTILRRYGVYYPDVSFGTVMAISMVPVYLLNGTVEGRNKRKAWILRFLVLLAGQLLAYSAIFGLNCWFVLSNSLLYQYLIGCIGMIVAVVLPLFTTEHPRYSNPTASIRSQRIKQIAAMLVCLVVPAVLLGITTLIGYSQTGSQLP